MYREGMLRYTAQIFARGLMCNKRGQSRRNLCVLAFFKREITWLEDSGKHLHLLAMRQTPHTVIMVHSRM
jgi:hypothetical protein